MQKAKWYAPLLGDTGILALLALARFVTHMVLNNRYGLHRDELAVLDYSSRLAWGYVEYPPLTPVLVRVATTLFGDSPAGTRLFSALGQALIVLLAGLIARDLGGGRKAQVLAALAAWISPVGLLGGSMTQYQSFDYVWWVVILWALVRLERTQNPRWWLVVGFFFGLGLLTKYTILVLAAGLALAVLATPMRRWLRSPWLWAAAGLALVMFLPNLIWQARNEWIAFEFTGTIHERDIEWGRTQEFLPNQLFVNASPALVPVWIGGLIWMLFAQKGKWRTFGLVWVAVIAILIAVQGRDYYAAGVYPLVLAGGAVAWEGWIIAMRPVWRKVTVGVTALLVVVGAAFGIAIALPVAPVHSALWDVAADVHDVFVEQLNWPELVEAVAEVYNGLPAEERARTGIYAGNYGEAGALNIYGPRFGLPPAISTINSYWLWGPGEIPPEQVIVLGMWVEWTEPMFSGCRIVAPIPNPLGIENEETSDYQGILLCSGIKYPWAEMWPELRHFG